MADIPNLGSSVEMPHKYAKLIDIRLQIYKTCILRHKWGIEPAATASRIMSGRYARLPRSSTEATPWMGNGTARPHSAILALDCCGHRGPRNKRSFCPLTCSGYWARGWRWESRRARLLRLGGRSLAQTDLLRLNAVYQWLYGARRLYLSLTIAHFPVECAALVDSRSRPVVPMSRHIRECRGRGP